MAREISTRISNGYILAIDRSSKAIQQAIAGSQKQIETGRLSFPVALDSQTLVHRKMKQIRLIFKWMTLLFFGVAIYAFSVGQFVPLEFANWRDMHLFYDIILKGLPVMILLTLVWTLNREKQKKTNIAIALTTVFLAGGMLFASFFLMFSYGFGAWIDQEVIYENKRNPEVTINRQLWDVGAFGYGGQRTVKLSKVLGLWNLVKEIDTAKIDEDDWTLVQEEGDIKFP